MSNTQQKPTIYVPKCSAKARQVSFGEVIRLSFKVEDLIPFLEEHVNSKGYINFDILPRKSGPSEYGDTHTVKLDTWEPTSTGGSQGQAPKSSKPAVKTQPAKSIKNNTPEAQSEDIGGDEIPF